MNINVDISEKDYSKIVKKVSEDLHDEIKDEITFDRLKETSSNMDIFRILDVFADIDTRTKPLEDKKVSELSNEEKALLMIKWGI